MGQIMDGDRPMCVRHGSTGSTAKTSFARHCPFRGMQPCLSAMDPEARLHPESTARAPPALGRSPVGTRAGEALSTFRCRDAATVENDGGGQSMNLRCAGVRLHYCCRSTALQLRATYEERLSCWTVSPRQLPRRRWAKPPRLKVPPQTAALYPASRA